MIPSYLCAKAVLTGKGRDGREGEASALKKLIKSMN